jgi:hypothetical protein
MLDERGINVDIVRNKLVVPTVFSLPFKIDAISTTPSIVSPARCSWNHEELRPLAMLRQTHGRRTTAKRAMLLPLLRGGCHRWCGVAT